MTSMYKPINPKGARTDMFGDIMSASLGVDYKATCLHHEPTLVLRPDGVYKDDYKIGDTWRDAYQTLSNQADEDGVGFDLVANTKESVYQKCIAHLKLEIEQVEQYLKKQKLKLQDILERGLSGCSHDELFSIKWYSGYKTIHIDMPDTERKEEANQ
jgi:hypothetical protein